MQKVIFNSERWLSIKDLDGEVWHCTSHKHILASTYGRLKREAHQTTVIRRGKRAYVVKYDERIYIQHKNGNGYPTICFTENGKRNSFLVHRLIAEAFIPNPQNLPFINHKDENPSNNCVFLNDDGTLNVEKTNLEWCTSKYNTNYGTCQKRHAESLRKVLRPRLRTIMQYTADGTLVATYKGKTEIEQAGFVYTTVTRSCRHQYSSSQGYVWRYNDDPFSPIIHNYNVDCCKKTVLCYDKDMNLVAEYFGLKEAAKAIKKSKRAAAQISRCCNGGRPTAFGFIWMYK